MIGLLDKDMVQLHANMFSECVACRWCMCFENRGIPMAIERW